MATLGIRPDRVARGEALFAGRHGHLLFLGTGLWCLCLFFFPTWLFGSQDPGPQRRALLGVLLWLGVSLGLLSAWLKTVSATEAEGEALPAPARKQTWTLLALGLGLVLLNLIPAAYPMTSSGDEMYPASTFRMLGKVGVLMAERVAPGFGKAVLAAGIAALGALGWLWWRLVCGRHRKAVLLASWAALGLALVAGLAGLPRLVNTLAESAFPGYEAGQLSALVRFPPLAKFLWLPVSLFWGDSVLALRIPSLVCWVLAGVVMHRLVGLRDPSWTALLPALLLLVLPGMFYFGHLVYLTAPMVLVWCAALYLFEAHRLTRRRLYLVSLALVLCVGLLLRRETVFLSMAILVYWVVRQIRNGAWTRERLVDGVGLAWFGLSLVPLWSILSEARPANLAAAHLLDPARLVAIANDFPYHVGPVAMLVLLFASFVVLRRKGRTYYSPALLMVGGLVVAFSYGFFTLDYLIPDERLLGVFPWGRSWQTAHRFLVSWSPFIALFLAEGVVQLPRLRRPLPVGLALGAVLLAQATFWAAPLTLPDFTSIALRPAVEFPPLPDAEVVAYVERELAGPGTRILTSPELGLNFYRHRPFVRGDWMAEQWAPREEQTLQGLISFCRHNDVDVVVLPLLWMDYGRTEPEVARALMQDAQFTVRKVFTYQGQPAIVVAAFIR